MAVPKSFNRELSERTKLNVQDHLMEAIPAAIGGAVGAAATGVGQSIVPFLKRQLQDAYNIHAIRGLPEPFYSALHPKNRLKMYIAAGAGLTGLSAGAVAGGLMEKTRLMRNVGSTVVKMAGMDKEAILGPLIGFGVKHFGGQIVKSIGKQAIRSTGKMIVKHPIASTAVVGGGGFMVGKKLMGD